MNSLKIRINGHLWTRSTRNRRIMGVCAGLAEATGNDVKWIRIATMILAIIIPGASVIPVLIAYVCLGLLLPEDTSPLANE